MYIMSSSQPELPSQGDPVKEKKKEGKRRTVRDWGGQPGEDGLGGGQPGGWEDGTNCPPVTSRSFRFDLGY